MLYIFSIILAFVSFSYSIDAQAQPNAKSETTAANPDMLAVKKASEGFMVAFNNLEWETFRNSFADDATVFFPFWQVPPLANGRTEVEAVFKSFFDAQKKRKPNPPYQNLVPKDEHIQMLGDVAIVSFHLGTELPTGRRTMVYRKQNGKWLIAHMHASNVAKPEEPKKETSAVAQSVAKELAGTYKSSVELNETDSSYKT